MGHVKQKGAYEHVDSDHPVQAQSITWAFAVHGTAQIIALDKQDTSNEHPQYAFIQK